MIDPRHVEAGVLVDDWTGLYKESWTGVIIPEAFAHPAKYSRALIRFIYQHVIDCGWIKPGDSVCDPFGGVALGGFDAMQNGLHWIGCELEEKFVGLGNQNIALWNERFSRMPNWGSARLIQGDSRQLSTILDKARLTVSSPPYVTDQLGGGGNKHDKVIDAMKAGYGASEGQLGAMKEGDHQLVISSPPYVSGGHHPDQTGAWGGQAQANTKDQAGYGGTEGQMGRMKEGDVNLAISSPPYVAISPEKSSKSVDYAKQYETYRAQGGGASFDKFVATQKLHSQGYGDSDGQLSAMKSGSFDVAISSPPYTTGDSAGPESLTSRKDGAAQRMFNAQGWREGGQVSEGNLATLNDKDFQAAISSPPYEGIRMDGGKIAKEEQGGMRPYSEDPVDAWMTTRDQTNIGNNRPDDFWHASRTILEQLYQVIIPGGHAVFVVKAFVRDKKIVDFPGQWAQLCEAVGFRLLHDHHALLTEHYGTQQTMHGEGDKNLTVARKSFFRRLAESKGSPKIDYENVLCFERPL